MKRDFVDLFLSLIGEGGGGGGGGSSLLPRKFLVIVTIRLLFRRSTEGW